MGRRKHRFRSLEELALEFQRRAMSGSHPPKGDFEHWKQAVHFRSIRELSKDFLRRQRDHNFGSDAPLHCYFRDRLLCVRTAMESVGRAATTGSLGFRTIGVGLLQDHKGDSKDCAEDLRVDHGSHTGNMEARLSRKSVAALKNSASLGECSSGMTFEEHVKASAQVIEVCPSTSGGESSERASESGAGDWEDSYGVLGQMDFGYFNSTCWDLACSDSEYLESGYLDYGYQYMDQHYVDSPNLFGGYNDPNLYQLLQQF